MQQNPLNGIEEVAADEDPRRAPKLYLKILLVLYSCTALTVISASINFGSFATNVLIAFAIASFKAVLVLLYFMHLRHGKPIPTLVFCSTVLFLGILLALSMIDATTRVAVTSPASVPLKTYLPVR